MPFTGLFDWHTSNPKVFHFSNLISQKLQYLSSSHLYLDSFMRSIESEIKYIFSFQWFKWWWRKEHFCRRQQRQISKQNLPKIPTDSQAKLIKRYTFYFENIPLIRTAFITSAKVFFFYILCPFCGVSWQRIVLLPRLLL